MPTAGRLIYVSAGRSTRGYQQQQLWVSAIWCASTQKTALVCWRHRVLLSSRRKVTKFYFVCRRERALTAGTWRLGAPANPDSHEVLEWVGTYIDMDTIKQTQTSPQAEPEFWRHQARSEANFRAENLCEARTVMHAGQHLQVIDRFINVLSQRADNLCGVLQAIADATVEAIAGAEFCLVALPESDSSGLKLTAVGGAENFAAGKTPHVQNKLLWKAFATGESVLWRSECGDGGLPAAGGGAAAGAGGRGRLCGG